MTINLPREERLSGCLIGCAVGDSLLLPAEGLSRSAVARRFPGPLRQRLVCSRGLISDDTEHAFLTAQALLASGTDARRFARELAARMRWWLLALPGGCGLATGRGILRLWCGIPPERSGVRSAGNGPAMRAAIIGLRWAADRPQRVAFLTASTHLTHRDPQALSAALAVAEAAAWIANDEPLSALWEAWQRCGDDAPWVDLMATLQRLFTAGASVDDAAQALGCPHYVSGYAMHSVPLALFAWLRHRHDPATGVEALLRCGGDTDTMAAIAGALFGADDGEAVFPPQWISHICEWPISVPRLRSAGLALAQNHTRAVHWMWPLLPVRNLVFLVVILGHGMRRLWPW
jgi:ADP-ribosylglycohydrolase